MILDEPTDAGVDIDTISWLLCMALRDEGFVVQIDEAVPWHKRVVADYGNGPCLTSPALAFDWLVRRRLQAAS